MTHNDYTKLMLNIKDNNIYFYDNFVELQFFTTFWSHIIDNCTNFIKISNKCKKKK